MDLVDLAWKIAEQQGILALILLLMMYQNAKERSAILHKNCELNHFIMKCLQQKIDEDSLHHNACPGSASGYQNGGHMSEETIAPSDNKIVPR